MPQESESFCAYCGRRAEGNFSIHRDGYGIGPEVELCDCCAKGPHPTCPEIWDRIAVDRFAQKDPAKRKNTVKGWWERLPLHAFRFSGFCCLVVGILHSDMTMMVVGLIAMWMKV